MITFPDALVISTEMRTSRRQIGNRLRSVANIRGKHVQASTGRELTYWCAYEVVGEAELAYVTVINDGRDYLGRHEATLRYDPFGIPAGAFVRMNLRRFLDRASFRQGKPPDPTWIGWFGPCL